MRVEIMLYSEKIELSLPTDVTDISLIVSVMGSTECPPRSMHIITNMKDIAHIVCHVYDLVILLKRSLLQ